MTGTPIFLRGLNGILMLAFPFLLGGFVLRRSKGGWRIIGVGAAGFILSQIGHIPFNQFLLMPGLERWGIDLLAESGRSLLILGVAAGLSAGVFEESARYLIFRFWLREDKGSGVPWKYGVGHGGTEAFLTGLFTLYALVQVMALGGEGALEGFSVERAALIQSQLDAYWAVPWHQALLGAWERISALFFHLGASVFVYKGVWDKRPGWALLAVLGHTAFNAFAVIAVRHMDLVLLELLLFVMASLWLLWAWFVRPQGLEEGVEVPPPPKSDFRTPQITSKQLEESRYE